MLIVFKELISIDPTWKLMLFGKGDLESEIKEQVESLELTDKVLFMGIKDNVGDYLSAMDIFVFHHYMRVCHLLCLKLRQMV